MSGEGNRTVFQPSPLAGGAPAHAPLPPPSAPPPRFANEDVPEPARPRERRNVMVAEATPLLALAAAIQSGRAREPLARFHAQASQMVTAFDRALAPHYPVEQRQRAAYALCSTVDDIAQNLPGVGAEASEWARRSLVVQVFRENIGGDRFWQICEEVLARPQGHGDLIELLHACLAAGFEGRFRVMPDGRRRLDEIMKRLFAALDGANAVSERELVPHWRGVDAPAATVGSLSRAALAAAIAAVCLLALYVGLRVSLAQTGRPAWDALAALSPSEPLRLTRGGGGLPPGDSAQAARLEAFLAPEIAQKLVTVDRDAASVRVRTTIGQLFRSGSDALEPGRDMLFRRIGAAVEREPGAVAVEGHADSDRPNGLTFPDNTALSAARAETVAALLRGVMSEGGRVTAQGLGDSQPIASNATAAGKALNRRVEIVLERRD